MGRAAKGFTLLELIIVLVLIVASASLAGVFFSNALPSARVGASARELSALIRQARASARATGEAKKVLIDFDGRRFTVEGGRSYAIPSGVSVRAIDPDTGDVERGTYPLVLYETGAVEGGTIMLWSRNKRVQVALDPVLGSVVMK